MKRFRGFAPTHRQLISCIFGIAVGMMVVFASIATRAAESQVGVLPTPQAESTGNEIEKLKYEIDELKVEKDKLSAETEKLKFENGPLGRWVIPIALPTGIAFLGLVGSILGAWWTIQNERKKTLKEIKANLDEATHEKRLTCYHQLTESMSPLALFSRRR
jgi:hypothetical protein